MSCCCELGVFAISRKNSHHHKFFLIPYALTNVPRSGGTKKNHNFVDMADTQPENVAVMTLFLCWSAEVMM